MIAGYDPEPGNSHYGLLDLARHDGVAVSAKDQQGQEQHWRARFLVDASGRDTLVANIRR